jgi:hypothetical protein
MWVDDTERPNYWDGQYVRASDFVATVEYGREMRRRLSLAQHAWGIFRGLDLVERPRAGSTTQVDLFISPGLAIDGFGRELGVYHPLALSPTLFQRYPSEKWVRVWLRYDTDLINPPTSGFQTCNDPGAAYRTLETVRVELGEVGEISRVHDPIQVDGKSIVEAQYPDELSIPFQALPDDDELTSSWWLVPIGYAHWNGADGFIAAADDTDRAKQRKGRVYGGEVASHTYAPDATWELVAGLPDVPQDPGDPKSPLVRPVVDATVRGRLTVTHHLIAKSRVRLDGGPLSFALDNGDETVPITFKRLGLPTDPGATLALHIGSANQGDSRFVVRSAGTTDRFSVDDRGNSVVGHNLVVRNVLTTGRNDKDTYVLDGATDAVNTVALGLEASSQVLYARAPSGLRVYLDETTADKDHQVLQADSFGVRIRNALVVGWGNDSHLQSRHVIGKASGSDGIDHLYLNWANGKDVVVGQVGGTTSDLHVSGDVYVGGNHVPLTTPIDVKVGRLSAIMPGVFPIATYADAWVNTVQPSGVTGSRTFRIKSNLADAAKTPQVTVSLTNIFNNSVATDAQWNVFAIPASRIDDQTWEFNFFWLITDDGGILDVSYTAVFYP